MPRKGEGSIHQTGPLRDLYPGIRRSWVDQEFNSLDAVRRL
jgi:hypothetical protein